MSDERYPILVARLTKKLGFFEKPLAERGGGRGGESPWAGSGLTVGEIQRMTGWTPRQEPPAPAPPVEPLKLKRARRAKVRRLRPVPASTDGRSTE